MLDALIDRIRPAETAAALLINLLLALLIIILGMAFARLVKRRLTLTMARTRAGGNLAVLIGNTGFIGVVLLALVFALRLFGLDATALLAVLGVGTVAVGLALQDVLKNLFAGIYLLLEQPFRIGDTIVVDNREGEVESIDIRTTVLRLRDGTQALVPNALVFATTVMNRTAYPARRVTIRLAGLTGDLAAITERVQAALRDQPDLVHPPGPRVYVEAISAGKTTAIIELWRRADRDLAPSVLPALQATFPEADGTLV